MRRSFFRSPAHVPLKSDRHALGLEHMESSDGRRSFLTSPGQAQIQSDLFYDYRTNVDAYPKWQAWMRETQPHLLVLWGKHDLSFDSGEPERYRRDVPNAEVHVLNAGHFALDTKADEIAVLVGDFTKRQK